MIKRAVGLSCLLLSMAGCAAFDVGIDEDSFDPSIGVVIDRPDQTNGVIRARIPFGQYFAGKPVPQDSAPWGLETTRRWSRQTSLIPVSLQSWPRSYEFWYSWWLLDVLSIHREHLSNPLNLIDKDPGLLFATFGSERFTAYIPPDSAAKFIASLSGATEDSILGVRFSPFWKDTLVVADLADNGVAKAKGVRRKDRLLAINGVPAFPADSAWSRLRSLPRASDIELTVLHATGDSQTISMRPRPAHFASVWFDTLAFGSGYLRIERFVNDSGFETGKQVKAAVAALAGTLKPGGWLILDLLDNGGGEIDNSLASASAFLPAGDTLIHMISMEVDSLTAQGSLSESWPVSSGQVLPEGVNLAILANRWSASASEILISALNENFRSGKLRRIGSRTYGKGIGQSVISTPAGAFVKVTSLDILPVRAPSYHLLGIAPTDEVADGTELDFALSLVSGAVAARKVSGTSTIRAAPSGGSPSEPMAWRRGLSPLHSK